MLTMLGSEAVYVELETFMAAFTQRGFIYNFGYYVGIIAS